MVASIILTSLIQGLHHLVNDVHFFDHGKGILDGYIKKFVLCQECANPETKLTVRKNGIIETCQACGYKGIFIW